MPELPNLEFLKELCGYNDVIVNKLLCNLQQEFPIDFEKYFEFSQKKLQFEASNKVHKLINTMSMFGMDESRRIALNYETNLRNNGWDGKEEFETALKTIFNYLKFLQ